MQQAKYKLNKQNKNILLKITVTRTGIKKNICVSEVVAFNL